jgi:hypothetical protein
MERLKASKQDALIVASWLVKESSAIIAVSLLL